MLNPEVAVNLLPEFGVSVNLVRHGRWLGETNEFHKRLLILRLTAPNPRGTRNQSSRGALNSHLALVDSGLQLNLEIALSGASAKVKPPPTGPFTPGESALRRRMT